MGGSSCKCNPCAGEEGGVDKVDKLNDEHVPTMQALNGHESLDSGKLRFLTQVKLFNQLPREDMRALASCAESVEFEVGQVIIRQGEDGHEFFILKSGEASVIVDGLEVITLSGGDYFGEGSLLRDEARTATIQAFTKITALKVTRKRFDELRLRDKVEFAKRQAVGGGAAHMQDSVRDPSPKTDEERTLMKEALMKNKNLQTMVALDEKSVSQLIDIAWKEMVPKDTELITEGDLSADYFYIVQSGCFDVMRQDSGTHCFYERMATTEAAQVGEATVGDSFGELALLYYAPRAATIKAREASVVWVIHRAAFKAVMEATQQEILEEYKKFLGQVQELSALLGDEQELVAKSLTEMTWSKDDEIFKQGEKGLDFYILVEGEVAVLLDGEETVRLKSTSDRRHCFGEKALLNDKPRAATIRVVSDFAKTLSLDKKTFELLLGPLPDIQKRGKRGKSLARANPFESEKEDPDRTFGNILMGDLKRVGLLGCGGFGAVELVEHVGTGETYALKALSKGYIVKTHMQHAVLMEKTVQLKCDSPFVIKLYETYNSPQHLQLLLELALGGELYATYQKKAFHGKERHSKYYVGGTVFALEHLHARKIIYRDLKPENLILTEKGKVKLTDMGLAKVVIGKSYTTCGTPDYFAPELVTSSGHNKAVDWWTLGVLIFELMVGRTPFDAYSPMLIYKKVTRGMAKVQFPSNIKGGPVEDLVKALCQHVPAERLPMKKGGTDNIKEHKWYSGFAWDALQSGEMTAPYIPDVKGKKDMKNFTARKADRPPTITYKDDGSGWDADFATSK